jgi:hypothetical protein
VPRPGGSPTPMGVRACLIFLTDNVGIYAQESLDFVYHRV